MIRIVLIWVVILFVSLPLSAREQILHSYLYHGFKVYDRENNLIRDLPSTNGDPLGLFLVAEVDGDKFLSVTVAENTVYEFRIVFSETIENKGFYALEYSGGMMVDGQAVPIRVYLYYTTSPLPDFVLVDVYKSPTFIELSGLIETGR